MNSPRSPIVYPVTLTDEDRTRLLRLAICVTATFAARIVAEEARVSPADVAEFEAVQSERQRARNAHEASLKAWYEATRTILLGEAS